VVGGAGLPVVSSQRAERAAAPADGSWTVADGRCTVKAGLLVRAVLFLAFMVAFFAAAGAAAASSAWPWLVVNGLIGLFFAVLGVGLLRRFLRSGRRRGHLEAPGGEIQGGP
jgi:hypothetical protein